MSSVALTPSTSDESEASSIASSAPGAHTSTTSDAANCAVAIIVRIFIKPGMIGAFAEQVATVRSHMLKEPSVLGLEVHQAISDPSCFVFYDKFDSLHFPQTILPQKAYFRDYLAATVPMWAKERETTICRVLECLN